MMNGKVDPHIAWADEARKKRTRVSRSDFPETDLEEICSEIFLIENLIAGTPADTLSGVYEQVRLALERGEERALLGETEIVALGRAVRTLRRLAKSG